MSQLNDLRPYHWFWLSVGAQHPEEQMQSQWVVHFTAASAELLQGAGEGGAWKGAGQSGMGLALSSTVQTLMVSTVRPMPALWGKIHGVPKNC